MQGVSIKMSFAKTVTLDQKTIDFIEFLMEELSIENFSQALRISITYASIYKKNTSDRERQTADLAIIKYRLMEQAKTITKAENIFTDIQRILLGRWSNEQKIAKLKEIL